MSKTYIGLDPGSDGFLCAMTEGRFDFISFKDEKPHKIADYLRLVKESGEVTACMEDVHSVFGSSAKSNFNFGVNVGTITGLLIALRIPYVKVPPKDWQKEIWVNGDKVKSDGKTDTKKTSMNAARRLFPDIDLRKNLRCSVPHDGKCDSLLICEYARRKNL